MDPFFATVVRRALESRGVECRVAYSARAAAVLAQSQRFLIAFLGTRLPDGTGLNLIAPLRLRHLFPIVVTGTDDSPAFQREVLAAGADEYVLKPITVTQVRDIVEKWTTMR
jgi:DNA-binding response OmpR family regulator